MKTRMVVYRTCDRPDYTARTWPRLVAASNPDSWVVVVENSGDITNLAANLATFAEHPGDKTLIHVVGYPLGVNQPIFAACDIYENYHGEPPDYVLVADDDVLLPDGWDDECVRLIETGRWDVTGIGRWARLATLELEGEGDAEAYELRQMAGGGCAFPYDLLTEFTTAGKAGLNIWSEQFRCAWSPRMVKREIDKYRDPDWRMG